MPAYHRLEWLPGQSPEVARQQERSGEIWGRIARVGIVPCVKAYRGPLPAGVRGVEFETDIEPDRGGPPGIATWSGPRPGVVVDGDYAKIRVTIRRNEQVDDAGT